MSQLQLPVESQTFCASSYIPAVWAMSLDVRITYNLMLVFREVKK